MKKTFKKSDILAFNDSLQAKTTDEAWELLVEEPQNYAYGLEFGQQSFS